MSTAETGAQINFGDLTPYLKKYGSINRMGRL
jgi:hypothetical protein